MCLPIDDSAMLCWLENQSRILEAWQDELASRPDSAPLQVERLARHHAWLNEELSRLSPLRQVA